MSIKRKLELNSQHKDRSQDKLYPQAQGHDLGMASAPVRGGKSQLLEM